MRISRYAPLLTLAFVFSLFFFTHQANAYVDFAMSGTASGGSGYANSGPPPGNYSSVFTSNNGSLSITLTPDVALPSGWEFELKYGDCGTAPISQPCGPQYLGWPGYSQYVDASTPGAPPIGGGSTQCSDGADNDGNSLIDYPDDPGCSDSNDNDESGGAGTFKWLLPKIAHAQTSNSFNFNISGLAAGRYYSFSAQLCEPVPDRTCDRTAWVLVGVSSSTGTINISQSPVSGGTWTLSGPTPTSPNQTQYTGLSPGTYTLTCTSAPAGYTCGTPSPPSQTVSAGGNYNMTVNYDLIQQYNVNCSAGAGGTFPLTARV